jgi:hypothetical protein
MDDRIGMEAAFMSRSSWCIAFALAKGASGAGARESSWQQSPYPSAKSYPPSGAPAVECRLPN